MDADKMKHTRGLPGQLGSSSRSSMTGSYRRCSPYMRTVVAPMHSTTSSTIPYLHEVSHHFSMKNIKTVCCHIYAGPAAGMWHFKWHCKGLI